MQRYKDIKFWISPSIRINRTEFLIKGILLSPLQIIFNLYAKDLVNTPNQYVLYIIGIPLIIESLISTRQRMNDIDYIKWKHLFLFLIPYIFVFILFFKKGVSHTNIYGNQA